MRLRPTIPSFLIVGVLVAAGIAAAPGTSGATQIASGTMCAVFNPSAFGCAQQGTSTQNSYIEARHFDLPVFVYAADTGTTPRNNLVVFFHGHPGEPKNGYVEFFNYATSLGFDVVTLDYDYTNDYPVPGGGAPVYPPSAACGVTAPNKCDMSLPAVCGCNSDCYDQRFSAMWRGGIHAGLPKVNDVWSAEARLQRVVQWVATNSSISPQVRTRFGSYLKPAALPGPVDWTKVIVAGHSMGSILATYIAKHQQVARVVLFSGPPSRLAPNYDASTSTWTKAYDCQSCTSYSAGCTCSPTTYGYAAHNGGTACTPSDTPVGWIANGAWVTTIDHFYGLIDSDDDVTNWYTVGHVIDAHLNWQTMGLNAQHDAGYSDGWNLVGDYVAPAGLQPGNYHGAVSYSSTGALSQICATPNAMGQVASGHNATVVSGVCGTSGAALTNRNAVWSFLLTH